MYSELFSLCRARPCALGLIGLLLYLPQAMAGEARALNLLDLLDVAKASDPSWLELQAQHNASAAGTDKARSALRPQVYFNANGTYNIQHVQAEGSPPFGGTQDLRFINHRYSLTLRQPLYRRQNHIRHDQARLLELRTQAMLEQGYQHLIVRVSQAYFDLLFAGEDLRYEQDRRRALQRQLQQARQRLSVGLGDITDVEEASAGADQAQADVIAAENARELAREKLYALIGRDTGNIFPLQNEPPLLRPQPEDIERWSVQAQEENPGVLAAGYALEHQQAEVRHRRAGRLPVLDLVGGPSYLGSSGRFGGSDTTDFTVGLEMQMPIYTGGSVDASVREAGFHRQALEQNLERTRRTARSSAREAYLSILSGISRLQALKQAIISSETALKATQTGYELGTRTSVEVVGSEKNLSKAQRDYARARYQYLIDGLRLKQAAGILSPSDLEPINTWLHPPATAPGTQKEES